MCACVCMRVWCSHVWMWAYTWCGTHVEVRVHPQMAVLIFNLVWSKVSVIIWLCVPCQEPRAPGNSPISASHYPCRSAGITHPVFTWLLGSQTPFLTVEWQVFYLLSHLPSPNITFLSPTLVLKSQITLLKLYIYPYILYWLLFYILLSFRFCAKIKSGLWYLDVAQWSNASVLTWVLGSVLSPGKWGGVVTALKYLITVCTVTFIGQLPFVCYCVPFSSGHELPRSLSIWESLSRLHFLVDSFTSYSVPSY